MKWSRDTAAIEAEWSDDCDEDNLEEDMVFGLFDGKPPGTPGSKAFSAAPIRYSPVSSESHEPGSLKGTEVKKKEPEL